MNLAELKPLLAALVLPPTGPLLLALLGLLLAVGRRRSGLLIAVLGIAALWLLSCNAVAIAISQRLLPTYAPTSVAQLKAQRVQAIVVLGGGVKPMAPEYGRALPGIQTEARMRYGIYLARQSGLPLAFAGGASWAADGVTASEASTAIELARDSGVTLRWIDDKSRDTAENATRIREVMAASGIQRIALVTNAWHMGRSEKLFRRAGFETVAAPMGFIVSTERPLLEWMPSTSGLNDSRNVLREWLALKVDALRN
ncbi:MAG: YdcF family protein [Pseudomonadota bacterium]